MGVSVSFTWNPEPYMEKDLYPRIANGLNAAAGVLARQMAENVVDRSAGSGEGFAGSRGGASRRKRVGDGGSTVSEPGQFPSNQLGNLRKSIRVHRTASAHFLAAFAGSEFSGLGMSGYARRLEFGSSRVAPRPFLRPALISSVGRMKSAFFTAARQDPGAGGSDPAAVSASRKNTRPSAGAAAIP